MRLRIPEGVYNVSWYKSPRFKMELLNLFNNQVSIKRRILIHHGNFPKDTEGCLLLGSIRFHNSIGGSRQKLKELNDFISKYSVNQVRVEIINDFEN